MFQIGHPSKLSRILSALINDHEMSSTSLTASRKFKLRAELVSFIKFTLVTYRLTLSLLESFHKQVCLFIFLYMGKFPYKFGKVFH